MNVKQNAAKLWLLQALPAGLAFAVCYTAMISPKLSRLIVEQGKLNKLTAETLTAQSTATDKRLNELQQESSSLLAKLDDLKQGSKRLVSQNHATAIESPAQSIASMVELLSDQGLRCISCTSNRLNKLATPEQAKTGVTTRMDSQQNAQISSGGKHEVQLELEGTFVQLQSSLAELRRSTRGFEIASITMSEASAHSSIRCWKLRVLV